MKLKKNIQYNNHNAICYHMFNKIVRKCVTVASENALWWKICDLNSIFPELNKQENYKCVGDVTFAGICLS